MHHDPSTRQRNKGTMNSTKQLKDKIESSIARELSNQIQIQLSNDPIRLLENYSYHGCRVTNSENRRPHPGLLHFVASGHWLSLLRSLLQPAKGHFKSLNQVSHCFKRCFDYEDRCKRWIFGLKKHICKREPENSDHLCGNTGMLQNWFQDRQTF